jgi:hypothetical protein
VAVQNGLQDKPIARQAGSRAKEGRRKLLDQQLKTLLEDYQAGQLSNSEYWLYISDFG